jgi:surfactin synthase thioesterase subunit
MFDYMNTRNEKIKVICFCHAGGSAYNYSSFKQYFPNNIEFTPYDLPGHGSKIRKDLMRNMDDLLDTLYVDIAPTLDSPYAFYGHSLGAVIAFSLTQKICINHKNQPIHLFLSGRGNSSYLHNDKIQRHLLPKDAFRTMLKDMGGMPKSVLENEELMDFFEPIIRADFELLESYCSVSSDKLNIPFSVFIGDSEKTTKEEAQQWQNETTIPIQLHIMQGDHFFIFDRTQEIVSEMTSVLNSTKTPYRSA